MKISALGTFSNLTGDELNQALIPIVVNNITRKTKGTNITDLCGGGTLGGTVQNPNPLTGGQNIITSYERNTANTYNLSVAFSFPGIVVPYPANPATPPVGWLYCNGQAVSRAEYSELFKVIQTTYGAGDGSATFNLPDLRGRIPFTASLSASSPLNGAVFSSGNYQTVASTGGSETHTLTVNEARIRDHTHNASGEMKVYGQTLYYTFDGECSPSGSYADGNRPGSIGGPGTQFPLSISNLQTGAQTWSSTPSAAVAPHNNISPCFALTYLIKT